LTSDAPGSTQSGSLGGDVYVMKVILHDWDDRTSIDILRTCRRAMSATATRNGGFRMTEIIPTRSPQNIIVARPMSIE
jgi:hypothetical protein